MTKHRRKSKLKAFLVALVWFVILLVVWALVLMFGSCKADITPTPTKPPTSVPTPTATLEPPTPTATEEPIAPTKTLKPTATVKPTKTPRPTYTPVVVEPTIAPSGPRICGSFIRTDEGVEYIWYITDTACVGARFR